MTADFQSNFDPDPYDDDIYSLGNVAQTHMQPIPVTIVDKTGDDDQSYRKIIDHDDFAPVIIAPATQSVYYMVREGWVFDVSYIVIATFTGGTVSLYKNFISDEQLKYTWPSAGIFTWSKGQFPLRNGDQLIFVANSVTGNVTPSLSGKLVRRHFWGEYII